jgi:hypothetical protein
MSRLASNPPAAEHAVQLTAVSVQGLEVLPAYGAAAFCSFGSRQSVQTLHDDRLIQHTTHRSRRFAGGIELA